MYLILILDSAEELEFSQNLHLSVILTKPIDTSCISSVQKGYIDTILARVNHYYDGLLLGPAGLHRIVIYFYSL